MIGNILTSILADVLVGLLPMPHPAPHVEPAPEVCIGRFVRAMPSEKWVCVANIAPTVESEK